MGLFEELSSVVKESIMENLTPEESEEERKMLAHPDMRPCDFDGTLEAWLLRLTVWGTVEIKHNDPENGQKGRVVSNDYFLDKVGNAEANKLYGLWNIDQLATNRLIFYRRYQDMEGKNRKEEFDIEIKLKSNLQQAIDKVQKKGLFGWLKFFNNK